MFKETYIQFGTVIKQLRTKREESLSTTAKSIGITKSYLHKLEKGLNKPTLKTLQLIVKHFKLDSNKEYELKNLLGLLTEDTSQKKRIKVSENQDGKEVNIKIMQDEQIKNQNNPVVSLSDKTPVLYTDSAFVTSRPFGITIDFAQFMGPTDKQNVVARVGMSVDHAEVLVGLLKKKISEAKLLSKSITKNQGNN